MEGIACPRCETPDPFGPAEIIFGPKHFFYVECRKCSLRWIVEEWEEWTVDVSN